MERKRKRELRELNRRAWAGEKDVFKVAGSLDSSLKKNTAFIKRLRTSITTATATTCLQEIRALSLHKYLSEIITASYEGLCRLKTPSEIAAGVEIVSGLHQRFGPAEYTAQLGWLLGRGLSIPDRAFLKSLTQEAKEKEEKERLARQRVLLKVVTELWLVSALRSLEDTTKPEDATVVKTKESSHPSKVSDGGAKPRPNSKSTDTEAFPIEVLKELLGHDREHTNLPLAVLFAKTFSWDTLGVPPEGVKGRQTVDGDGTILSPDGEQKDDSLEALTDDPPLSSPELLQRFKAIFTRYLEDVKAHIVRDQEAIAKQSRKNAEAYVKSGEVFEDRQANFDRQVKSQEKLISNAQVLCDILGVDMPDLKEKDGADAGAGGGIGLVKTGEYLRGQGDGAGIWEDDEERRFYENLVDVKDRVPGILLEDAKKKKVDPDEQVGKRNDKDDPAEKPPSPEPNEEQSTAIANKTVGAQVDALLANLPEMQSKDSVDEIAIEFCFLNSKASRNRLIKSLQDIPKGRTDLLPLYARLVATLGKYMPDVTQGLVASLDEEFRSLQRRKQKEFLGSVRTGNVRYLAELTKFGVVPEHVIFHCLKVSLDDFSRVNIEIIANLLENCGRYLLRNPETSPRMQSFLETLQRKKTAQVLGQQERMLIENAIYYVNPPERAAIQQKERTPTELYIRRLLYSDMNKRTYNKIIKSIRKLHWEEDEVVAILQTVMSKPGKAKYGNIYLMAIVTGALFRYHPAFVVWVIDSLLEHITLGLEQNDFKFNQRRIAEVKYLAELYNYKMVDSPVIFDTLYRIVTFGHQGGTPVAGRPCPLDLPDDFFRVRLVCTVLDACGNCFDRGAARKKLDFFLTFFQYYLRTKEPMPLDIEFVVLDTFALVRPQWKLVETLEEAGQLFADAVQQNYKSEEKAGANGTSGNAGEQLEDGLDDEDESDDDDGDDEHDVDADGNLSDDADGEAEAAEEEDQDEKNGDLSSESDFGDDSLIVTRGTAEPQRDPEADAEFDRELAKLMAESGVEARKASVVARPQFDVPLPAMIRRGTKDLSNGGAANDDIDGDESKSKSKEVEKPTMAFSLMTKKGNKPQTRTIELPSDSNFAVAMKTQIEAERAEQQRIKNLVLNYDLQDDAGSGGSHDGFGSGSGDSRNPNASLHTHHFHPSHHHSGSRGGNERSGGNRGQQRGRKLQLSDVDW